MATTNVIKTRIQLKYDSISNWNSSTLVLRQGELAIAEIPSATSNSGLTPPAIGIKVGDGSKTFSQLPWIQSIAGDVYAWAKASTKPTYDATEITNLNSYISGQIQDTNTQYKIVEGTGANANKYYLQKKDVGDADYSNLADQPFLDLTDIITKLGSSSVSDQIDAKINALDVNNISGFGAGKTLSALSETDGKISATFQDISITLSQVSNAGTAAAATVATSAITDSDSSTDLTTKAQVASYVATKTAGLTGAMHFKGTATVAITDGSTTNPTITGYDWSTKEAGDVVTYGAKEFVWTGTAWEELGNEGSYALSSIKVEGANGLTGGGTLTENRTISHATRPATSATANATFGGTANKHLASVAVDAYGHVFKATEADDITYTFATGSTNGSIAVTTVTGGTAGTATDVAVKGLTDTAYTEKVTSVGSGNTDDGKIPTVAAVKGIVNGLDSSVSATAVSNGQYSVLTGVTQTDGKLASKTEVTLAKIATSGSIYDVNEASTTSGATPISYLLFDCGNSTEDWSTPSNA